MKLVKFIRDARPHQGYTSIFVNPEEVASVQPNRDNDNRTEIKMRDGTFHLITDYAEVCAEKLDAACATGVVDRLSALEAQLKTLCDKVDGVQNSLLD